LVEESLMIEGTIGQTQWLENEWFYRLDLNEEVLVEGDLC